MLFKHHDERHVECMSSDRQSRSGDISQHDGDDDVDDDDDDDHDDYSRTFIATATLPMMKALLLDAAGDGDHDAPDMARTFSTL